MSWAFAPAGFVRGPRMLNTVRTPISRLTEATFFMAGWKLGANMKPIPISSIALSTTFAGERSIAMFCHRNAGGRDYESSGGADIERLRSISASSASIQQVTVYFRVDSLAELPHYLRQSCDFVSCFSLLLQSYQKCCDL